MLTHSEERRQFGGGFRVLAGIIAETLLSGLTAPVIMIFQSSAVGGILLGRDVGWQVQRRADGAVPRKETFRKYAIPTMFGIVMAISAYAVSLPLLLWMMPVVLGLLMAIPLATISGSARTKIASVLFKTPEETSPPAVLLRSNELVRSFGQALPCPFLELCSNADLLKAHLINLADPKPRSRGEIDFQLAIARAKIEDAETFEEAVAFLNSREKFAVLNSRNVFDALMSLPSPKAYLRR